MLLEFHREVASDISRIMDHYEDISGLQLAEEFYAELRSFFQKAAGSPEAYRVRERDLRRVNLERFPFHFLFRISMTACAYWLYGTIEGGRRLGSPDVSRSKKKSCQLSIRPIRRPSIRRSSPRWTIRIRYSTRCAARGLR